MANRIDRLYERRTDAAVRTQGLNEVYARIQQSEAVRYVVGAMQPIDSEYTKNTYEQADRVINQLKKGLKSSCSYDFQGSVTNNTHIKARSDIDVLLLTDKFFTLEPPQQPASRYQGDVLQDLLDLRADAASVLRDAFPEATVDSGGSKSISIEGGSLRRKIDVVPSNWFNTNAYAVSGLKRDRAIQILDAKKKERLKNMPFLHNHHLDEKDKRTQGGLRKAARLMKSLKYDENIDMSSYDLVSLAYNMDDVALMARAGQDLIILESCASFCHYLTENEQARNALVVPDGHRKIFSSGHATEAALRHLAASLAALVRDVLTENARSFRRLAEARVEY